MIKTLCGLICIWSMTNVLGFAETLEIDFRKVATDPLADYTPASSPGDKSVITREGLRVQQVSDRKGTTDPPREIGAKMLISASGDFRAELDWEAKKIESPTEGWGQGVIFTIELDDPEITELQMGFIASPRMKAEVRAAYKGVRVKKPIYRSFPNPFQSGVFVIERKGGEAIFSVIQDGVTTELTRLNCPTSDLRYASVWCTRLPKGNTASDYLFRTLRVSSDSFFAFQSSRGPRWAWWQIALLVQAACLIVLIGFKITRK